MRSWWKQFPRPYKVILAMIVCKGMADIYFSITKGV